jgi:hypothetical protein
MARMLPPPSRVAWLVDGEMRGGHSVAETVAYLDWCADWADAHPPPRPQSPFVISPRAEPRAVTRLRRLFGR